MSTAEALKMAIEALEILTPSFTEMKGYSVGHGAIELCKSALLELENSEPVALADETLVCTISMEMIKELELRNGNKFPYPLWPTKLYTLPHKHQWVGLSNDTVLELESKFTSNPFENIRAIESKLKELNHE